MSLNEVTSCCKSGSLSGESRVASDPPAMVAAASVTRRSGTSTLPLKRNPSTPATAVTAITAMTSVDLMVPSVSATSSIGKISK